MPEHPLDVCYCGDYRRDHKDGHGACIFNHTPGGPHGDSQCLKFRFVATVAYAAVTYLEPDLLRTVLVLIVAGNCVAAVAAYVGIY